VEVSACAQTTEASMATPIRSVFIAALLFRSSTDFDLGFERYRRVIVRQRARPEVAAPMTGSGGRSSIHRLILLGSAPAFAGCPPSRA
jgi:hypothetical protein